MHNRRDGGHDRGGPRRDRGRDDRHHGRDGGRDRRGSGEHGGAERRDEGGREERRGPGPDTRFLQLEMSQLLFGEAEKVTKEAFREVLLEAAKHRLRERFGEQLRGIAELAVDEAMNDVFASLEIEACIQERHDEREQRRERLRDIFAAAGGHGECGEEHGEGEGCEDEHEHDEGNGEGPGDEDR